MLKAVVTKVDEKQMLVLGISEENVKRLKEDKPILFDGEILGLNTDEVMIYYCKTEQLLEAQFKSIFGNNEDQRH